MVWEEPPHIWCQKCCVSRTVKISFMCTAKYLAASLGFTRCRNTYTVWKTKNVSRGTALVVHWLRIHLPMQGTQNCPPGFLILCCKVLELQEPLERQLAERVISGPYSQKDSCVELQNTKLIKSQLLLWLSQNWRAQNNHQHLFET